MTAQNTDIIGILGVGHLARHLVPTLAEKFGSARLLLSPRGTDSSAKLARDHGIDIAADNADLVARSRTILVSVRPFQVADALGGAPWTEEHRLVSFCAGVPLETFAAHAAPAEIIRAMPVTAGQYGESPTCLFPETGWARDLLEVFGPVIPLRREDQFEAASVIAAYYGWVQALIGAVTDKTAAAGLDPDQARLLVAQMTRAAATTVRDDTSLPIGALVDDLCLPGSITGHGLGVLRDRDTFAAWEAAFDAVLEKLQTDQD